jgi:hypothetical protein
MDSCPIHDGHPVPVGGWCPFCVMAYEDAMRLEDERTPPMAADDPRRDELPPF